MEKENTTKVRLLDVSVENVKRISEVQAEILPTGLTVVGGKNCTGKSSFVHAIAWALGGDRFRPTAAANTKSEDPPYIKVTLNNGYTVERSGKNSALKVTCPEGKGGVAALREFISPFALDLSKFTNASEPEKIKILLAQFPELGKQLDALVAQEKTVYNERHEIGVLADSKTKYAENLVYDDNAPESLVDVADVTARLAEAHKQNNVRQEVARKLESISAAKETAKKRLAELAVQRKMLEAQQKKMYDECVRLAADAEKTLQELIDTPCVDVSEIQNELELIEVTNTAYRHNETKRQAAGEAAELRERYETCNTEIEEIRAKQRELLKPLSGIIDGLSLDSGLLTYNQQQWDCMSTSEQYKVATAICSRLNPSCGFVLIDRLETMDVETMQEFGEWLTERGLQAIGTRVSTTDECTFIIEDGHRKEEF